jgi:hypothetical protein
MSEYMKMIKEIQKEYPLSSPNRVHIESPLDCAFMITVDSLGCETPESVYRNMETVRDYKVRRRLKWELKQIGV